MCALLLLYVSRRTHTYAERMLARTRGKNFCSACEEFI